MTKGKEKRALLVCLLLPVLGGALVGWLTRSGMADFARLDQPPLSPPGWLFPVVWSVLYLLMGLASWLVYRAAAPQPRRRRALIVYGVQLLVNWIWPILFFHGDWYLLSFCWLVALWLLVLATVFCFGRCDRRAAWLLIPYLLWLSFAAYLNFAIYLLN